MNTTRHGGFDIELHAGSRLRRSDANRGSYDRIMDAVA
jgi:hypothetical protein